MMLDACIVHTYLKYACKKSYIHAWMFVRMYMCIICCMYIMLMHVYESPCPFLDNSSTKGGGGKGGGGGGRAGQPIRGRDGEY